MTTVERPTNELRHIEREVLFIENGINLAKVIVVLQQRIEVIKTGELVWQDVPLVELGAEQGGLTMTDYEKLVAAARAQYDTMTTEEQDEMWRRQRENFVRGMGPCEHGVRDFETCPQCLAI